MNSNEGSSEGVFQNTEMDVDIQYGDLFFPDSDEDSDSLMDSYMEVNNHGTVVPEAPPDDWLDEMSDQEEEQEAEQSDEGGENEQIEINNDYPHYGRRELRRNVG